MKRRISLLLAALALIPVLSQCSPLYMLTTPSVLRIDHMENVIVEAHEINADTNIDVRLQFFPKTNQIIFSTHSVIPAAIGYVSVAVQISKDRIPKDARMPEFVVVEVLAPAFTLERTILISYQLGHIFIQTDKPIYTPAQTVLYRLLTVNYEMKPIKRTILVDFVNPHDVIVKREEVFAKDDSGITGSTFKVPEIVNIGVWKIAASYKDASHINYTTEFEVKEYVLPSFEVSLQARNQFFYVDDNKLDIGITARFTYGEPVEGRAFVLFGVMKDGEKFSIPSSLQSVSITDGEGIASLTRKAMTDTFPNIQELVGCSIYITASVITYTGSDMVEAEKTGIKIVTSPYTILFTKTSKYFKPGMPFDLMVFVTNPDGSPARGIPVRANDGTVDSNTQADGLARLTINTDGLPQNLPVKVETNVANLPKHRQATANMVAEPYKTKDGSTNYLHIGIQPMELVPGNNLVVTLNLRNDNPSTQNQINYFTYMLISKGQILSVGRQQRDQGQIVMNMLVPITPDLIPSFRLLVYYYLRKSSIELVADSVWIDVKDTCIGTLKVSAANAHDENKIYKPGKGFQLRLTGDSGATVGLVAVDKAVFVLNKKNKLTQSKIWDVVEKNDIACTPGGGKDVFGVFSDAGLTFVTSSDIKTPTRTELKCKRQMKRKRRSTSLVDAKAAKLMTYKEDLPRKCCQAGMKKNPMGFSCTKRAKRILHGRICITAFLDCCNHVKKFQEDLEKIKMTLARSDDDDYYSPYEDIISRSDFPESWLWLLKTLPVDPRGGSVTKDVSSYLKDSITTWEVQAVSVSPQKGICVAQPYELVVKKDFFIDLRLPYSVIRNEQVEVRAILYNYEEEEIKVRVEFPYNENLCSSAKQTQRFRIEVMVPAKGSIAVPYVVVPLINGEIDIEVKASVFDRLVTDGVRKRLLVVPEGIRVDSVKTYELDPKGKEEMINVDVKVPGDMVPHTEPLSFISVQGDILAQTIENTIDGAKLKHLIRVPSGCGEQNMASMTPVAIVTNYLDKTNQWERVGFERRDDAVKLIQQGYTQQLKYRKPDGTYAAWIHKPSSTWLTAYVLKVFAMSYRLIDIQPHILCDAANWLILHRQQPDGHFREDAPVIHQEMIGGVRGSESDSSLTAFVLIAMQEAKFVCSIYVQGYEDSIKKAGEYLENHIDNLNRVYSVTITSYALSLLNKDKTDILMRFASQDKSYWAENGNANSLYTIEATGYALLTLTQLQKFDQAGKAVRWLSLRSEYGGGYVSTQATMVALQSLAKYQADIPQVKDTDLNVVMTIPGRSMPIRWHFDVQNQFVAKSARVNAFDKVVINATGQGKGTVKVLTTCHVMLSKNAKECKKFNFQVTVENVPRALQPPDAVNSLKLTVCARYLADTVSSMVIVDISMLTGFSPDLGDLQLLMSDVEGYISKFEMDKALSTKGSLIVYLDTISNTEDTCFGFKVHQLFKVGLIQPASIRIYEYYDTENSCTKFYNVKENSAMLNKICQGDVCRCAEGSCISVTLPEKHIPSDQREDKACEPGTDYVYQVSFLNKEKKENYIYYDMEIISIIKPGSDDVVVKQQRQLVTHANCEGTFEVELEKQYLIMGQGSDLWKDGERISYLIGAETWVEMWPDDIECQERRYRRLCVDLSAFSEALMVNGCST